MAEIATAFASVVARFRKSKAANVALVFALSAPLFVAALGLGLETGLWYLQSNRLQQAADIGAYAASQEMLLGASTSRVRAVAVEEASRNGYDPALGPSTVNVPPASGSHRNANSVEVLLTNTWPRLFSGFFSSTPVTLNARGVATIQSTGTACMLALSPTASRAANFSGNGTVTLNGCSIVSNSNASDALRVWGSALVTTDCVYAVGGTQTDDGLTLTECSEPQEQSVPSPDPFANTPMATPPAGNCVNAPALPLPNVRYCSMTLTGVRTLAPGDYFIQGGTFRINANANITATGVTFHLLNGATADFNGNARVNLSAPLTGPRKGMLFMSNSTTGVNRMNGNAQSRMTGALYFPHNEVQYNGNFGGANGCMQVVANVIDFSGSATFSVNCAAAGMTPIESARYARLTE